MVTHGDVLLHQIDLGTRKPQECIQLIDHQQVLQMVSHAHLQCRPKLCRMLCVGLLVPSMCRPIIRFAPENLQCPCCMTDGG